MESASSQMSGIDDENLQWAQMACTIGKCLQMR